MLPTLIILSLGIGSVVLFVLSAVFWFPLWRKRNSGSAHGLFLTNAGLTLVVVFKLVQVIGTLVEQGTCEFPFNMASAILMMTVGIFQFCLSRGYFNYKEA